MFCHSLAPDEFQSTHPLGVRLTYEAIFARFGLFQSTHPLGVRRNAADIHVASLTVSIHAPTRGATRYCTFFRWLLGCFNPRTHSGCDSSSVLMMSAKRMFQSTHPLGVRLSARANKSHAVAVSIHAPTRGATCWLCLLLSTQ